MSLAQQRQIEPSGHLRISMPGDLANVALVPMLAAFVAKYPAVSLQVDLSPRRVDLVGENFDLAIRMGELPDDASLAARRIAVFSVGLYASPEYLAQHGAPAEPEALMEHDALRLLMRNGEPMPWILSRGEQRWEGIPPGRATINSPELLIRLAEVGAGITIVADHYAQPYAQRGTLVRVLPDWHLPETNAWAVFPGRRLMPTRTRAFIDMLTEEFSSAECQARAGVKNP